MRTRLSLALSAAIFALAHQPAKLAPAQHPYRVIYPEQRQIDYRDPSATWPIPLPPSAAPPTYSNPPAGDVRYFALDDAIRTSLGNMDVVRLLAGVTAVNSGRTIYDPAIVNTSIDQALGRFDPAIVVNNTWSYDDLPSAVRGNAIVGSATDRHRLDLDLRKQNPLGGVADLGLVTTRESFTLDPQLPQPGLNPLGTSVLGLGYTQPFLKGAGLRANLAPVVLARINTEISFFQLKDTVQQNVRDVISGYWSLVSARATVIARQLQVNSLQFQYDRLDALKRFGIGNLADAAQAHVSLAQFKAQRIAAETDVLQREAALRNLLGLPPWDDARIVPTTEPLPDRVQPNWQELVDLAAARRPDLVELKLILEADEQQRIIANNNALPQLDGFGVYRWNGREGELPNGNGFLSTAPGQFTGWDLGVNFSVPLGLRAARAQLRQRELLIARDRANLDQGLHAASHDLATTLRSLDQAYEQYIAYTEARTAAQENIEVQDKEFEVGRAILLSYLLAVTDLGNAIVLQAQSLALYNTLLADLELQTGTILETHGVRFYEERYGSIGPLGRLAQPVCYPESAPPTPNADRYPIGDKPSERFFNLPDPMQFRRVPRQLEDLPPPAPPGR